MKQIILICSLVILVAFSLQGQVEEAVDTVFIDNWLVVGPQVVSYPVFANVPDVSNKTFQLKDFLSRDIMDISSLKPAAQLSLNPHFPGAIEWQEMSCEEDGQLVLDYSDTSPAITWFSCYVTANRFAEVIFAVNTNAETVFFFDGEKMNSKGKNDDGFTEYKLKLEPGKHTFIIKTVFDGTQDDEAITFSGYITDNSDAGNIAVTTSSKKPFDINTLLSATTISGATVSFDGNYVLVSYYKQIDEDTRQTYKQILDVSSGKPVGDFAVANARNTVWAPASLHIYYAADGIIYKYDPFSGTRVQVSDKVKEMTSFRISPDESYAIVSVQEKYDEKNPMRRIKHMPDRWPNWRNRTQLFLLDFDIGIPVQITHGNLTSSLYDISKDGSSILIGQSYPDFEERPYSKGHLFNYHIDTDRLDTVWYDKSYGGYVSYSPDGKKLLVVGSPVMFGKTGAAALQHEHDVHNDYDSQAYLYTLENNEVVSLTQDFDPKIIQARWIGDKGDIVFLAEDRWYQKIYFLSGKDKKIAACNTPVDVVTGMSIADNGAVVIAWGTSAQQPGNLFKVSPKTKKGTVLLEPGTDDIADITFGEITPWHFKSEAGDTIEGMVFFPPNFDPGKKYPMIVYYYGGTNPTKLSFGGRYAKDLFAAQGYVILVLNPSGATGYGQQFSAAHVNNWGITVADEIIDATKQYSATHSFIDPAKIGCIGASYGGFMTQLILTKTDIFSAAVSHAGISLLSSYWGEGFWGYAYSSSATANNFPWNNPDIYVNQSPLHNADKITTPLLLLHGNIDDNVPPGESRQLFVALKMLNRDVELIEIDKQGHHITDYKKRIAWQKTILAWFDYKLKGESEWWDYIYPKENY
ncbi:MAG: prolyl oligopeptidase family serine peptidase [Bacteroidales bacterium]|nr:prolyl oligopeptidase family serine peptidase [Bacteroidales bacterium]